VTPSHILAACRAAVGGRPVRLPFNRARALQKSPGTDMQGYPGTRTVSNTNDLALPGRHSVFELALGLLHNAVQKSIVVPGIVMEQN